MRSLTIGLPRALVFYYYYPMWKKLFESLGCEVVVSDPTTTTSLEDGIRTSVADICAPIKIFNGHVIDLLKKGVDYCFIPRFVSAGKFDEWFCPKFIGLPELVKDTIPELSGRLLEIDINTTREDACDVKNYYPLCEKLCVSRKEMKRAVIAAQEYFEQFRLLCRKGYTIDEACDVLCGKDIPLPPQDAPITIALLGYVYNVYDPLLSMDIIKKLRSMGVRVLTFEMMEEKEILPPNHQKHIFWYFARKVYFAGKYILEHDMADGVLHLTAFVCGPDSVVGTYLSEECDAHNRPFMTLRVDEHSGESHLQTRIEAYIDMIKRKKYLKGE